MKVIGIMETSVDYEQILKSATNYAENGEFSRAISILTKFLPKAEKLNQVYPEVDVRNQLGIIYWKSGNFDLFLETTANALALARVHNYNKGIAEALLNLAWVLVMEKKDFMRAFDFTEESLKVSEKLEYTKGIATALYIIGTAYKEKSITEKSKYYIDKSIKISKKLAESDLLIPSEKGLSSKEKDQMREVLDLLE